MTSPVHFKSRKISIKGYTLGVLLGDNTNNSTVAITRDNANKSDLDKLGLLGTKAETKFIPDSYKYNSIKVRTSVLQGLIDTDAEIREGGTIIYTSKSHALAADVVFLVQSLGGVARLNERTGIKGYEDNVYYNVTINLPEGIIPARSSRRLDRYATRKRKYNPTRAFKSIEYIGMKEAQCIMIDHPDHLYLTDDFVVTHNTVQVLSFIKTYKSIKKIVIVCPKTAKNVWEIEARKWGIDDLIFVVDGRPDQYDMSEGFADARIVVINYDMLGTIKTDKKKKNKDGSPKTYWTKWMPYLLDWKADMLVCDEIHFIKNRKAARTKAVEALGYKMKFVLGLTGTPVANSPMEIFTVANMIRPKMFNYTNFNYRYCGGEAMRCRQAYNAEELHSILTSTFMIRRLKKDVLSELPPKRSIQVNLEIDMKKYDAIIDQWMKERDMVTTAMTYMAKLRECIAHDKIPPLLEWCDKFLENTGRKLIIFAHHKIIRDMLYKHFEGMAVKIEGGMKDTDRNSAVDRFQNDDSIRVFVGSITACAEAITLTAASDVCMAEMIYNPKKMEQAEDRAHRKGQTEKVNIWNLVCMGTYEEDILSILEEKRIMSAQVIDGKSAKEAGASVEKEVTYRLIEMLSQRIYN